MPKMTRILDLNGIMTQFSKVSQGLALKTYYIAAQQRHGDNFYL